MTVNSSRTKEYNIDDLVLVAHRRAGLVHIAQGMSEEQGAWGRQLLELTMKHLETLGVQVRVQEFETIQLTAGEGIYSMSADVLDIIGPGAYIGADDPDPDHPSSTIQVSLISQMQWQQRSAEAAEGNPTRAYVHRAGALVQAWLWPLPVEDGQIRFPVQLLFPDCTDGSKTPGTQRPWAQYLTFELAWQLADAADKSRDKVGSLKGVANEKLKECRGFSAERVPYQISMNHPIGRGH